MHSSRTPHCPFCKRNNEPPPVYNSHFLRDSRGLVSCPQLKRHTCNLCGATGVYSHTRSHCPQAQRMKMEREEQLQRRRIEQAMNQAPPVGAYATGGRGERLLSTTTSSSSSSSSASLPPMPSVSGEHQQNLIQLTNPPRPRLVELSNNGLRNFCNMSSVSNSRFNSAGRLRRRQGSGDLNNNNSRSNNNNNYRFGELKHN